MGDTATRPKGRHIILILLLTPFVATALALVTIKFGGSAFLVFLVAMAVALIGGTWAAVLFVGPENVNDRLGLARGYLRRRP